MSKRSLLPPLVQVPAGQFTRFGQKVVISSDFFIGETPITQAEYECLVGTNPSHFRGSDRPVDQVSWNDAVRFCNALSRARGLDEAYQFDGSSVRWLVTESTGYRLPTEAEWEHACRAGTRSSRYGPVDEIAWYDENSGRETQPVRLKRPNAWGLYDMLGNVLEWCWDWYDARLPNVEVCDPLGPPTGSCRTVRGGWAAQGAGYARSLQRSSWEADGRLRGIGFRVVWSIP